MQQHIRNTIVETKAFLRSATALWSEPEIDGLKEYLATNPMAGDEISSTGGLRKLRWGRAGMGKRGGARVIYYFYDDTAPLFLLEVYSKAQQKDLSPSEKKSLSKIAVYLKESIKKN